MFNPKYTITPKLLENIKQITALVTLLNSKKFSRTILMRLEKAAQEFSAYSSTSIEGNPLPLTEVKKILKNKPAHLRDSEKEVVNYNRALQRLDSLIADKNPTPDLKLILKIHADVMEGLAAKTRCGHLRAEPVFVNDPKTGKHVYLPPDHKDVRLLMEGLVRYVKKNQTADPLILAGLFHRQFVIIHPFIDGNGRTARLATKVILATMGINTFPLFSFENYYNQNVTRYFEKVGVFGDYYELKDDIDFTSWLEYFTDGIIDELLRVEKELKTSAATPDTTLKDYHLKMLRHIRENGYITDSDYARFSNRAKATRSLDFKKMIGMGLIERLGKGKSTYYKIKDE
ncbi:Fic family protein [Patescibacteria group bacterium]|nr:Fic family protein [Patescibacteria group bacterium]